MIYDSSINPIKIPSGGVTLWGQKTLNMTTVNIKGITKEEDCLEECNKCNGTGADPNFKDVRDNNKCSFCNGTGKVEWLDKLYNRPKRKGFRTNWSLDAVADLKAFQGVDVEQEMIQSMSDHLAKEIDKEILNSLGVNNE